MMQAGCIYTYLLLLVMVTESNQRSKRLPQIKFTISGCAVYADPKSIVCIMTNKPNTQHVFLQLVTFLYRHAQQPFPNLPMTTTFAGSRVQALVALPPKPAVSSSRTGGRKKTKQSTERSRLCRQRQQVRTQELEQQVLAVKHEISRLALRRERVLYAPHTLTGSFVRAAHEYCNLFKNGLRRPENSELQYQTQVAFVNSLFDPDVEIMSCDLPVVNGVHAFLQGWQVYANWGAVQTCDVHSIIVRESMDLFAVTLKGVKRVYLSPSIIELLFPHVLDNRPLLLKITGKQLCYFTVENLYFNAQGRVVRYIIHIDFFATLYQLVGNNRDVLELMKSCSSTSPQDVFVREYILLSSESSSPPSSIACDSTRDSRLHVDFLLS